MVWLAWDRYQRQAVSVVGVCDVNQVVRDQAKLLLRRLGGANVHVPVYQPAVPVDYLPVKALRQFKRQAALARGRRPNNGDQGVGFGEIQVTVVGKWQAEEAKRIEAAREARCLFGFPSCLVHILPKRIVECPVYLS